MHSCQLHQFKLIFGGKWGVYHLTSCNAETKTSSPLHHLHNILYSTVMTLFKFINARFVSISFPQFKLNHICLMIYIKLYGQAKRKRCGGIVVTVPDEVWGILDEIVGQIVIVYLMFTSSVIMSETPSIKSYEWDAMVNISFVIA